MLLELLVSWWRKENPIKEGTAEIVVAISYCTGKDRLMEATKANLANAINFCTRHHHAHLCFSRGCSYPFNGAEDVEWSLKIETIPPYMHRPVVGGPMVNTVDEAFNIRDELRAKGLISSIRRILICTGPVHARSAYLIYRELFPGSVVYLQLCAQGDETQPDHSVRSQRSPWVWFISNIARHVALLVLPLKVVRKIKRKSANET